MSDDHLGAVEHEAAVGPAPPTPVPTDLTEEAGPKLAEAIPDDVRTTRGGLVIE